jgi:hypothetical protein
MLRVRYVKFPIAVTRLRSYVMRHRTVWPYGNDIFQKPSASVFNPDERSDTSFLIFLPVRQTRRFITKDRKIDGDSSACELYPKFLVWRYLNNYFTVFIP